MSRQRAADTALPLDAFADPSYLDRKVEVAKERLRRHASRPWVVAWSGGKDSTTVLHLAWEVAEGLGRRLTVVYHDALLEYPWVYDWVYGAILHLARRARVIVTVPREDYLTMVFGMGYSPPGPTKMWCTARFKVRPSVRLGLRGCLTLVGVRRESERRERLIERRAVGSPELLYYAESGWSVAPIYDWTAAGVWLFLRSRRQPWGGGDYSPLFRAYLGDLSIRSGCSLCTVVVAHRHLRRAAQVVDPKYARVGELLGQLHEIAMSPRYWRPGTTKLTEEGLRRVREILVEIFTIAPEFLRGYATHKPEVVERYLPEVAHLLPGQRMGVPDGVEIREL
jgi:3'-phosphoadenosine 5'-phosphosulfate sulfotransferase (PAPS reductase)/FAD synthetase